MLIIDDWHLVTLDLSSFLLSTDLRSPWPLISCRLIIGDTVAGLSPIKYWSQNLKIGLEDQSYQRTRGLFDVTCMIVCLTSCICCFDV